MKGLVLRYNVCEYEENPSTNKEVISKVKHFLAVVLSRPRSFDGQGHVE